MVSPTNAGGWAAPAVVPWLFLSQGYSILEFHLLGGSLVLTHHEQPKVPALTQELTATQEEE